MGQKSGRVLRLGWEWWQAPATGPKRNRWHSQRGTSVTGLRRAVPVFWLFRKRFAFPPWPRELGRSLLSLRLFGGVARALRWGFWRARVRGASLGLASQWADASGRSRCWQAQGFWALSSPPICASCGRTGPARALLPPPEYLGQYPGYRRSGGGSLARAARADCGAGQAALPDETGS